MCRIIQAECSTIYASGRLCGKPPFARTELISIVCHQPWCGETENVCPDWMHVMPYGYGQRSLEEGDRSCKVGASVSCRAVQHA
eukprot:3207255-Amphidinium_carterae.2